MITLIGSAQAKAEAIERSCENFYGD